MVTFSLQEQRVIIRFLYFRGVTPIEIHRQLSEACGDGTMDVCNVRSWVRQFNQDRTSCDNKPRQSRPRISRSDDMIQRVENVVLEDPTEMPILEAMSATVLDEDKPLRDQRLSLFLLCSSSTDEASNFGAAEHLMQRQTCDAQEEVRDDCESNPKMLAESQKKSGDLLTIDEVPFYLRRNPYILTGYRANLTIWQCIDGIFWWTNETINVWTHLMAFVLFVALLVWFTCTNPLVSLVSTSTKVFYYSLAACFISTMLFSTLYHMFIFRSEQLYNILHTLDLIGVAFSLLGIFIAAITHGFKCHGELKTLYLSTVTGIFLIMLILSIPCFEVRDTVKKWAFFLWTAYGIVPTIHWFYIMGGYDNSLVQEVMPRLVKLYGIGIVSFFFLVSKFPECLLPGWFDIIGSSHQWWHVLIVYAYMYCLYNACEFINYVKNVSCPDTPLY